MAHSPSELRPSLGSQHSSHMKNHTHKPQDTLNQTSSKHQPRPQPTNNQQTSSHQIGRGYQNFASLLQNSTNFTCMSTRLSHVWIIGCFSVLMEVRAKKLIQNITCGEFQGYIVSTLGLHINTCTNCTHQQRGQQHNS